MKELKRDLGPIGATALGLGSIVGTGVFVSLGLAADVAGSGVLLAVFLGALLALCNALSSAQLAAAYPVSGGTYEYGYRFASPFLGYLAGWLFLTAKSASAASATIAVGAYLGMQFGFIEIHPLLISVVVLLLLTLVVVSGIRLSGSVNAILVLFVLASLGIFVEASVYSRMHQVDLSTSGFSFLDLLHATGLVFVAYTGYGRIATLGEEVRNPEHTIPRAIVIALSIAAVLYFAVSVAALSLETPRNFAAVALSSGAPLEVLAERHLGQGVALIISLAAIAALVTVLLNLLLGLSRVVFAMGRRRDLPEVFATVSAAGSPTIAVIVVAAVICTISLMSSIQFAWTVSASLVLSYYAITNYCALKLKERLYPSWVSWLGLIACVVVAFSVLPHVWQVSLPIVGVGCVLYFATRTASRGERQAQQ